MLYEGVGKVVLCDGTIVARVRQCVAAYVPDFYRGECPDTPDGCTHDRLLPTVQVLAGRHLEEPHWFSLPAGQLLVWVCNQTHLQPLLELLLKDSYNIYNEQRK